MHAPARQESGGLGEGTPACEQGRQRGCWRGRLIKRDLGGQTTGQVGGSRSGGLGAGAAAARLAAPGRPPRSGDIQGVGLATDQSGQNVDWVHACSGAGDYTPVCIVGAISGHRPRKKPRSTSAAARPLMGCTGPRPPLLRNAKVHLSRRLSILRGTRRPRPAARLSLLCLPLVLSCRAGARPAGRPGRTARPPGCARLRAARAGVSAKRGPAGWGTRGVHATRAGGA